MVIDDHPEAKVNSKIINFEQANADFHKTKIYKKELIVYTIFAISFFVLFTLSFILR